MQIEPSSGGFGVPVGRTGAFRLSPTRRQTENRREERECREPEGSRRESYNSAYIPNRK